MAVPDFFFALQIDDASRGTELVDAVSAQLLRYAADTTALAAHVGDEVARAAAAARGRCTVQFRAAAGSLEVVVRNGDVEVWRAAHALP
ncbi:MAG: hypothetical protein ACM3SQ_09820 [Betaproteobacteria bacterium]